MRKVGKAVGDLPIAASSRPPGENCSLKLVSKKLAEHGRAAIAVALFRIAVERMALLALRLEMAAAGPAVPSMPLCAVCFERRGQIHFAVSFLSAPQATR